MSEDTLKARIRELEVDLNRKDTEIHNLLDRIEELEDNIMRLEALIPEVDTKKKSKKQQAIDSKLAIELDEKERQIRELKNSMGFLRKEKLQLQQELERIKSQKSDSSVIRVEDLRDKAPLNVLVKELQALVNTQRSTINKLRFQLSGKDDIDKQLNQKENEIERLKSQNLELNQQLKELVTESNEKRPNSMPKELIEDLQQQLTRYKRQIVELKHTIEKSDKKRKKYEKDISKVKELKREINDQKDLVKEKDNEIKELNKQLISFQKTEIAGNLEHDDVTSSEMIKTLKDDLQNKLNRAKIRIQSLEAELNKFQGLKPIKSVESQNELEGKFKMQREMIIFLQKQLETKDEEIETIKNEAVEIKRKYRQLENQLRLKDEKINELKHQPNNLSIQTQVQPIKIDSDLDLRIRELKNRIDRLQKLNNEQKIEISQLRKKV
ncbi:MAG: hypothetical protein ACFFDF_23195 [Candidatus Odinarchaeota archaeon]